MNYATIKNIDTANGEGVRVSLFVSGCRLNCKNCFNKEAQDFKYGKEFTDNILNHLMNLCSPHFIQGLSLLGGDPMEKENQPTILKVLREFKKRFPNKDVYMWTGRVYPKDFNIGGSVYLEGITEEILNLVDVLIDGPFVQELHSKSLKMRGSSNQKIINLKKEREERKNGNEND